MRNKEKIILTAISAVLTLASASTTYAADADTKQTEKCYGISKAGMNDCAAGANSCAGSAVKDAQPDAFLLLPTGLCGKIVGGTLKDASAKDVKKS